MNNPIYDFFKKVIDATASKTNTVFLVPPQNKTIGRSEFILTYLMKLDRFKGKTFDEVENSDYVKDLDSTYGVPNGDTPLEYDTTIAEFVMVNGKTLFKK